MKKLITIALLVVLSVGLNAQTASEKNFDEKASQLVSGMTLEGRDFSFFDSKRDMWIAQSGKFDIKVGSSSRDIHLTETIQLNSTQQVPLAFDEHTFFIEYWENPQTREYIKEMIPNWIEANAPDDKPLDEVTIDAFIANQPIVKFPYFTGGEITRQEVKELVEKCKGLTYQP